MHSSALMALTDLMLLLWQWRHDEHVAMFTSAGVSAIVVVAMAGSIIVSSIMEPLDVLFCADGVD